MKQTLNNEKTAQRIDFFIFSLIAFACLGYSVFSVSFAKLHLRLPFLDFPIFIGEILLFVCLSLLLLRQKYLPLVLQRWHIILAVYVGWVLVKALWGYAAGGPLAFRNAALFYYPLFAVIGFLVYRRGIFTQRMILGMLACVFFAKTALGLMSYHLFMYFILSIVLIKNIEKKWVRWAAIGLLIVLFPFKGFFQDSKTFIVGNIMGFSSLAVCFLMMARFPSKYKVLIATMILLMITYGSFRFTNKNQMKSLVTFQNVLQDFREKDAYIQERKASFAQRAIPPKLYYPGRGSFDHLLVALNLKEKISVPERDISEFKLKLARIIKNQKYKNVLLTLEVQDLIYKIQIDLVILQEINRTFSETVYVQKLDQRKVDELVKSVEEKIVHLEKTLMSLTAGVDSQMISSGGQQNQESISPTRERPKISAAESIPWTAGVPESKPPEAAISQAGSLEVSAAESSPVVTGNPELKLSDTEESQAGSLDVGSVDSTPSTGGVSEPKIPEAVVGPDDSSWATVQDSLNSQNSRYMHYTKDQLQAMTVPLSESAVSQRPSRPLMEEHGNMLFRLFVWRDMLAELWSENPLGGINFGKPQRSISIEILYMANGEWERDGWIMPHNSFLNLIYRGGIVGLGIIGFFIGVLIHLSKNFLIQRSSAGILLISIFIHSLTIANFLVFLEFPYHAIPFWTLLGMTCAFHEDKMPQA